ncbi:MAG: cbb3-type cytochrome c oxidase subunit I [Bacteroidetes bacterium]|nr:cbb3-type cytochrome c oxidase subunit I [Bacteroidota bacterium]
MIKQIHFGKLFFILALVVLLGGLLFGLLAAQVYIFPTFLKDTLDFSALRPLHVSLVVFWIIIGATASVISGLQILYPNTFSNNIAAVQFMLWFIATVGIVVGYFNKEFGGREYWEFNPIWALPIACSWFLFLINFLKSVLKIKKWPVYIWMWMTGIVFFLFTFFENYLWMFPYFRENFITDMTIQWKVNGSLVGSWNQIIYGTSFFLMDRISGENKVGYSKLSFAMFFLGLFNLMFNWGHHIYTLPTESYIRYIGYIVSMTEWVFFIRIIHDWKKSIQDIKSNYHFYPYRFIMAADFWIFVNMGQAILMSIPAINIFTHGTHVTVAHAMGTTIGINTMILFSACFIIFSTKTISYLKPSTSLNIVFWTIQISLLIFWLALNIAGVKKGIWQVFNTDMPHNIMMAKLLPWFITFNISGIVLMLSLAVLCLLIIFNYMKNILLTK